MQFLQIISLVPLIWLVFALMKLKMAGHWATISTLVLAIPMAIFLFHMTLPVALTSVLEGIVTAFWPIFVIILAAMFLYDMSVKSGAMETIKRMLASVSSDRRIIVLLICWGFGGFMEGMAGFGTAIAIPAVMLVGLGMDPIIAAVVAMISDIFTTPFGAVAIPTTTLAAVTGLDPIKTGIASGVQMAPLMLLVPFLLVIIAGGGLKALKGMVPITLLSGVSFVGPQLLVAYLMGPEIAITIGSLISLLCLVLYAKFFIKETPKEYELLAEEGEGQKQVDKISPARAWLPFLLILVLLIVTSKLFPGINSFLNQFKSAIKISSFATAKPDSFTWVNQPGIWIVLSTVIGALFQGMSATAIVKQFGATFKRLLKAMITIMAVVSIAKVMTYSGMIHDMALLFKGLTGHAYPFVAPIIGALGGFVTGSGTNTQVLLGPLQVEVAKEIGVNSYWLAAANQLGSGIGKVISPQSLAIVVAAASLAGREGEILKAATKWVVILLAVGILIVGLLEGVMVPLF